MKKCIACILCLVLLLSGCQALELLDQVREEEKELSLSISVPSGPQNTTSESSNPAASDEQSADQQAVKEEIVKMMRELPDPLDFGGIVGLEEIPLTEDAKAAYTDEYLGPALVRGLCTVSWMSIDELDIEVMLDTYEYFEFNLTLGAEYLQTHPGVNVYDEDIYLFVPQDVVEAYMRELIPIEPAKLRASGRYDLREKGYRMQVLEGLGGLSPMVGRAWRAGNLLLLEGAWYDSAARSYVLLEEDGQRLTALAGAYLPDTIDGLFMLMDEILMTGQPPIQARIDEIRGLEEIMMDEDARWALTDEYLYPLESIGLNCWSWAPGMELDAERALDNYEYHEFNRTLGMEYKLANPGIDLFDEPVYLSVPQDVVEDYILNIAWIDIAALRASERYVPEQEAYRMQVMDGLGGVSPSVKRAWRADHLVLIEQAYDYEGSEPFGYVLLTESPDGPIYHAVVILPEGAG